VDRLVLALGLAFAAGFAVQQALELLDPVLARLIGDADKKVVLGLVSLALGLILSFAAGLRVLQALGVSNVDFIDGVVTGLIISAGTEGFNSIMKFLGYAKEEKKGDAAVKKQAAATAGALPLVERR